MTHRNDGYRNMAEKIIKLHGPLTSIAIIHKWYDMPANRTRRRKLMPTRTQLSQILRTDKRFTKTSVNAGDVATWGLRE